MIKFVRRQVRKLFLLIHESPLTDALFLLVSKSDEVTTTQAGVARCGLGYGTATGNRDGSYVASRQLC